ncbi:MAG: DUF4248 domain-containing protein [Bacteroidaceae bacterium]|nr:DUF4248 domain-containing protein [Bacteroidaceae bacterium]
MQIRAYQKGELAQMYYPWCGKRHALRSFNKDVTHCHRLSKDLRRMGWTSQRRVLTERMVHLIIRALGEP